MRIEPCPRYFWRTYDGLACLRVKPWTLRDPLVGKLVKLRLSLAWMLYDPAIPGGLIHHVHTRHAVLSPMVRWCFHLGRTSGDAYASLIVKQRSH